MATNRTQMTSREVMARLSFIDAFFEALEKVDKLLYEKILQQMEISSPTHPNEVVFEEGKWVGNAWDYCDGFAPETAMDRAVKVIIETDSWT